MKRTFSFSLREYCEDPFLTIEMEDFLNSFEESLEDFRNKWGNDEICINDFLSSVKVKEYSSSDKEIIVSVEEEYGYYETSSYKLLVNLIDNSISIYKTPEELEKEAQWKALREKRLAEETSKQAAEKAAAEEQEAAIEASIDALKSLEQFIEKDNCSKGWKERAVNAAKKFGFKAGSGLNTITIIKEDRILAEISRERDEDWGYYKLIMSYNY